MSTAVHRTSTPSLSIPATQNTAPVLEFNCLYTHDIRRKQKRWQDGFLRFHTFNKRVMVYDVPRNFIGDMHWASAEAMQEGDEVMLEKDGVLVEVAQSVGRTETDLTELRASTKKVRPQTTSSPVRGAVNTPARAMAPPPTRPMTAHTGPQLKHRSLNALLGAPKGASGRAAPPSKSPFEVRQADMENTEWESERPAKWSRTESWSVTRTTTTPKAKVPQEAPLWQRTADARKAGAGKKKKKAAPAADQQRLGTKEIIDLSDDLDVPSSAFLPGFSSDAIMPPSSPATEVQAARCATPSASSRQQVPLAIARSSSPAFQTQHAPERRRDRPVQSRRLERPAETRAEALPAKKASRQDRGSPKHVAPPFLPPSTDPSTTLRMSTSASRKKTLACIDQLPKAPPIGSKSAGSRQTTEIITTSEVRNKTPGEKLKERLVRIERKKQQRAQDLQAVVDDAGDDVELDTNDTFNATAEISRLDETLLLHRDSSPRTEHAAGATEIIQIPDQDRPPDPLPADVISTVAKLQPTDARSRSAPVRQSRSFQRVLSESNTSVSISPKRIPGAPVRYTPSPTRRSVASDRGPNCASITPVANTVGTPPHASIPSDAPPDVEQTTQAPQKSAITKRAMLHPQAMEIPQAKGTSLAKPKAAPKRKGIGRKEIRKNAASCFPPALDTSANGTATVVLSKPFQAPKAPVAQHTPPEAKDVGPWSRDAYDLFTWRPPGWCEEDWRLGPDGDGDTA
nr:hypothetical protein B0A51_00704 [Rachicladosporium sp. CCFEE 5018]